MTLMPGTQFSLLTHFCAGQSNSTYFKAFEVSTLIFVLYEKKEFEQKNGLNILDIVEDIKKKKQKGQWKAMFFVQEKNFKEEEKNKLGKESH